MFYITRQDDISILGFSIRVQNCLRKARITTIGELLDYPKCSLAGIQNIGAKEHEEIQNMIQSILTGDGEFYLKDIQEPMAIEPLKDKKDIKIQDFQTSVRAKNALINAGYTFVSELFGVTYEELIQIRNMGEKTAQEVLAYLEKLFVSNTAVVCDMRIKQKNPLVTEMQTAYGETEKFWRRAIHKVKSEYLNIAEEQMIYHLYEQIYIRDLVKDKIIEILEENETKISRVKLEQVLPDHLRQTRTLEEILVEMESNHIIKSAGTMIYQVTSPLDDGDDVELEQQEEWEDSYYFLAAKNCAKAKDPHIGICIDADFAWLFGPNRPGNQDDIFSVAVMKDTLETMGIDEFWTAYGHCEFHFIQCNLFTGEKIISTERIRYGDAKKGGADIFLDLNPGFVLTFISDFCSADS